MGLTLIQGPPNSGRAGEVLGRFRAALDRQPVLVVPTADDVAAFERDLCAGGGAALGGSITAFAGLTAEVARVAAIELGPRLSPTQRLALVRAAIRRAAPRRLRRSAARPGFAPAADRLIAELQSALVSPAEFERLVAELEDPAYERELAAIYTAYAELRDRGRRSDKGVVAAAAISALTADPDAWGRRPVFLYGFDDLTRDQTELIALLARTAEVTVAVTYADTRALAARSGLLTRLIDELGAERPEPLPFDPDYTTSATLRHLDRHLFEPEAERIEPDGGLVLLDSAGGRGEAEAIGVEIARLLADGVRPDEIAIVLRHPDSSGPLLASVLGTLGIPVALEASMPVASTCVGTSLVALCRAVADEGAVDALLAHLRSDPSLDPGAVDWVERRIRRGKATTVAEATAGWEKPPRHLERLRNAPNAVARLRALARSARELAEGAHRAEAPHARSSPADAPGTPFSAVELRAGVAAAELLEELATLGDLPGAEAPGLADATEAIESATVPLWRGPAAGRVRVMSPYRARAARVKVLFCAGLQEGEFPSSAPPDPLLSEERRARIGNPDLRRADQADEERYLFHACVSRPTERLYCSWQSCDEDGAAKGRSPFVDEILDLIDAGREGEQRLLRVRGPERALLDAARRPPPARSPGRWRSPGRRPAGPRRSSGSASAPSRRRGPWPSSNGCRTRTPSPGRSPRRRSSRRCTRAGRSAPIRSRGGSRARTNGSSTTSSHRRCWTRRPTRSGSAAASTTRSSASTQRRPATTRSRARATSGAGKAASASCSTSPWPGNGAPPSTATAARWSSGPGSRSRPSSPPKPMRRPSSARLATCSSSASVSSTTFPRTGPSRARRSSSGRWSSGDGSTASTSRPTGEARSSATTRAART